MQIRFFYNGVLPNRSTASKFAPFSTNNLKISSLNSENEEKISANGKKKSSHFKHTAFQIQSDWIMQWIEFSKIQLNASIDQRLHFANIA